MIRVSGVLSGSDVARESAGCFRAHMLLAMKLSTNATMIEDVENLGLLVEVVVISPIRLQILLQPISNGVPMVTRTRRRSGVVSP